MPAETETNSSHEREEDISEEVGSVSQDTEEQDDEAESDASLSDASAGSEGQSGMTTGKKKKKKKKKKTPRAEPTSADSSEQAAKDAGPKRKQQNERVNQALQDIRSNSPDSMWVDLSCTWLDAKSIQKLCTHLESNTEILSLNLAGNDLLAEHAQALVAALAGGAAPNLLDLDLRDNSIDKEAETLLKKTLRDRKILNVQLGMTPAPAAPAAESPPKGRKTKSPPRKEPGGKDSALTDSLRGNSYVRQFFQMGEEEEEEEEEGRAVTAAEIAEDPAGLALRLWRQASVALDSDKPRLADLAAPLLALSEQLQLEMDDLMLPLLPDTTLTDLKPFAAKSMQHLALLAQVFQVPGQAHLTPFARDNPTPVLGLHRVAACELLAQLLRSEAPAIVRKVAQLGESSTNDLQTNTRKGGLLSTAAWLALRHGGCSAAQGAVLRCAKSVLSDAVGEVGLWKELLVTSSDEGKESLPNALARVCESAVGVAPGKRESSTGFALALAALLRSGGKPDEEEPKAWREELQQQLLQHASWVKLCESDGVLQQLLNEQQGELGGPKPQRMTLRGDDEAGGRILSGQDLINMLRGYNMLQQA